MTLVSQVVDVLGRDELPHRTGSAAVRRELISIAVSLCAAFQAMGITSALAVDIERLRVIPAVDIADRALGRLNARLLVSQPNGLFADNKEWQAQRELDLKKALGEVAALPSDRRALFWVLWLRRNMGLRMRQDGLHTFLLSDGGTYAPQALEGLGSLGLASESAILGEAMALFGSDFPVDSARRAAFFAWSTPGRRIDEYTTEPNPLNAFDRKLMAVSKRFAGREEFDAEISAAIERTPALSAWVEEARGKMTDEDRLNWLRRALTVSGKEPVLQEIARWPEPYRLIFVLDVAELEVMNGGVHQFFLNSSGDLAREFVAAARKTGASGPARAIEQGIALFDGAYSPNRDDRLAAMERLAAASPPREENWSEWDEKLNALTGKFDDGGVPSAELRLAKQAGILPR